MLTTIPSAARATSRQELAACARTFGVPHPLGYGVRHDPQPAFTRLAVMGIPISPGRRIQRRAVAPCLLSFAR